MKDAVDVLGEARFAVHESLADWLYYSERVQPAQPDQAVFFGKFYLDDAALRLYAVGEHMAEAIMCMLEVEEKGLKSYRERGSSRQVAVGKYLQKEKPESELTLAVEELLALEDWRWTISYRGEWVHAQPPTVAGTGIVFRRGKRWEEGDGSRILRVGGGDEPTLTVPELSRRLVSALREAHRCLSRVSDYYRRVLTEAGMVFKDGGRISIPLTGQAPDSAP